MARAVMIFLNLSFSFFALAANGFLVALEGASTTITPITITKTVQRQTGDITIRAAPLTLSTESRSESEQSGSSQVPIITPGVYMLQSGASAISVTSNTVTVSTGSSDVGSDLNTNAEANPISSTAANSALSSTDSTTPTTTTASASSSADLTTSTSITSSTSSSSFFSSSSTTSTSKTSSKEVKQSKVASLSSTSTPTTPTVFHSLTSPRPTSLLESERSSSAHRQTSPASPTSTKSTTTNTATKISFSSTPSSNHPSPSVNPQNDSESQSQRTGRIVGGVIGTFVILVLLSLFLFRFRHSTRSSISQWVGSLPSASDVSRTLNRVIGRARPHGHRGSLATRRRWYGISAGSRPQDSILPFSRGDRGEVQDMTDVSESGAAARGLSTTSTNDIPQFTTNGEMVEHPNHVPGTALHDHARVDSTTSIGVNSQSDINVGMAERPAQIPGTALYDLVRIPPTTSMGVNPQSGIDVGMAERPTQIPGNASYDVVRTDSTTSIGVTPQSGIDVGIAERPTHIPETAQYDPGHASSSTGDRYSISCTYRGGGFPWTPPPPFAAAMLKRKGSATSRPGHLDKSSPSESMVKELYQDVDPPPSYASHTP